VTAKSGNQSVEEMFNGIAHRYDLLNHILSFGVHILWRNRLVKSVLKINPTKVLDVATGTADVAIALAKRDRRVEIVGVDVAEKMLSVGRAKVQKLGLDHRIVLSQASAENLPFDDSTFSAVTVAYGVRNFNDLQRGLTMMYRVLESGGSIHILEFVKPKLMVMRLVFGLYFHRILPLIGRCISDHSNAYSYLPQSVQTFAERDDFVKMLLAAGFVSPGYSIQSFGIAAIYTAKKST